MEIAKCVQCGEEQRLYVTVEAKRLVMRMYKEGKPIDSQFLICYNPSCPNYQLVQLALPNRP